MKRGAGLVEVILVVAGAAVVYLLYASLLPYLTEGAQDNQCKASVLRAATTSGFFDLDCPIQEVEIGQNEIETSSAKRDIAERMRYCWDNFGRGDLDPFNKRLWGLGETACKVCAEISFDNTVETGAMNISRYLRNDMLRSETSYRDFLYGGKDTPHEYYTTPLDTTQQYYVIYRTCSEDFVTLPFSCQSKESAVYLVDADRYRNEMRCDYEFD
jgi:hypothetical protein